MPGFFHRARHEPAAHKEKSPPRPEPGRAGREGLGGGYLLSLYVRSPPSGLNDSTVYPAFFNAPATKPRTVCRCQPMVSMESTSKCTWGEG